MKNIFIDCEWVPRKKNSIFLFGYAYNLSSFGTLIGQKINVHEFKQILKPVTGYIILYGPDIGYIENQLVINLNDKYECINLLTCVRHRLHGLDSYKLYKIEKLLGTSRKTISNPAKVRQSPPKPAIVRHIAP